MPQGSFSASVDRWVAQTKERQIAVRNESAQRVIAIMQEPGPSVATTRAAISAGLGLGKVKKNGGRGVSKRAFGPITNPGGGGNLPVDTGFLRASLQVVTGNDLPPLKETPTDRTPVSYDPGQVTLALSGAALSAPVTAVYTAKYARRIEYGFHGKDSLGRSYSQSGRLFVALAAQQWPRIVSEVVAEAKTRAA